MDPKILPRSHAQNEIIVQLTRNKSLTFTELQKALKISRPAISRHLAILVKDNIIEFTKKGREKHYSINASSTKTLERKIDQIYLGYVVQFGLISPDPHEDPDKMLEALSNTLGCIFLLYIIKSMETGKDWTKNVRTNDFMLDSLEHILAQITEDEESLAEIDLESLRDNDELFEKINKMITDKRKLKNIKIILNDLRRVFPGQMEILDKKIKEQGLT